MTTETKVTSKARKPTGKTFTEMFNGLSENARKLLATAAILGVGILLISIMSALSPTVEPPTLQDINPTIAAATAADLPTAIPTPMPTAAAAAGTSVITVYHNVLVMTQAFTITANLQDLLLHVKGYASIRPDCVLVSFEGPPPGDGWICDPSIVAMEKHGPDFTKPQPTAAPYVPQAPAPVYVPQAPIPAPVQAVDPTEKHGSAIEMERPTSNTPPRPEPRPLPDCYLCTHDIPDSKSNGEKP